MGVITVVDIVGVDVVLVAVVVDVCIYFVVS